VVCLVGFGSSLTNYWPLYARVLEEPLHASRYTWRPFRCSNFCLDHNHTKMDGLGISVRPLAQCGRNHFYGALLAFSARWRFCSGPKKVWSVRLENKTVASDIVNSQVLRLLHVVCDLAGNDDWNHASRPQKFLQRLTEKNSAYNRQHRVLFRIHPSIRNSTLATHSCLRSYSS